MAEESKQLNISELDFDTIKENLKDYFKSQSNQTYSDWDFEGSGLSLLLDVLAYNTHYNSIIAHTSVNESFLDSAQLRPNVVSRAKLLGYIPRSRHASKAELKLTFPETVSNNDSFVLESGTQFQTELDGVTYNFITRNAYTTSKRNNNNDFVFDNVEIFEGKVKQSRFLLSSFSDTEQKIIIEDDNIDTSQMKVRVFESLNSNKFLTYKLWTTFENIDGNSPIYFLNENYDGNYDISFGNNIFGKQPNPKSVIVIDYLATRGPDANGANEFEWINAGTAPNEIKTLTRSYLGAERESIESIKFNAPLNLNAQNRAVTAQDYRSIITQFFPNIRSISVWGGQDNNPPIYGKTFISIQPPDGNFLNETQKKDILENLKGKSVVTVIPEIIDPEFIYLYFDVLFKYDSTKTIKTSGQLTTDVLNTIEEYENTNLKDFLGVFRHSEFVSKIDRTDKSILNSTVRVFTYKNIDLIYGDLTPKKILFDFEIDGKTDQKDTILTTDSWKYNDTILSLKDEYIPGSDLRNIYAFSLNNKGEEVKLFSSLGSLDIDKGLIELQPLPLNRDENINFFLKPRSNDVAGKRNTILLVDKGKINTVAEIDTISVSGSSGATNYNTFDRSKR